MNVSWHAYIYARLDLRMRHGTHIYMYAHPKLGDLMIAASYKLHSPGGDVSHVWMSHIYAHLHSASWCSRQGALAEEMRHIYGWVMWHICPPRFGNLLFAPTRHERVKPNTRMSHGTCINSPRLGKLFFARRRHGANEGVPSKFRK